MYETSARYKTVVAGSHRAVVRVQLLTTIQTGAAPTGGTVLPVLDGDIKMSSTSDVKATLDITVPGDYWDVVQPYGAELFAERGVDFADGTSEYVPLGYFRIKEIDQDQAPYGPVRISAEDRIAQMIDCRLIYPLQYPADTTHAELFDRLLNQLPAPSTETRRGYGMYEPQAVVVSFAFDAYDGTRATLPAGVVEDSVYEHLAKIVDARGCVLRFNRLGQLRVVLRDTAPGAPSVYTIQPGKTGNLIKASRQVRRGGVYNMIVARGSDPANPTGSRLAYNADPTSPLYWAGPFGVVPRYYASPLIKTADEADDAAETVLSRYRGLPSGLAVATVPDPSLDPLDPITIVVGGQTQAHVIDEVSIPLVGSSPVQIETRALNEIANEDTGSIPDIGGGTAPDPTDTPTDTDTGTPAPAGTNMAAVLRIGPTPGFNHFNLGVGFSPGDAPGTSAAKHVDYGQSDIAGGLTIPDYAEVLTAGRVRLSQHFDGGKTSSNTKYPRTEYREMAQDGTTRASWDSSKPGRHYIKGKTRIVRLPPNKPHVVIAQIHDASDDVATWRIEKPNVYARYSNSENVGTTTMVLDTDYEWMIEVVNTNGGATCQIHYYWGTTLPSSPSYTKTAPTGTGWYFKAGNYGQSNTTFDAVEDGPIIIEMSSLECWHTGYPAPSTVDPGTGTGGSTGDGSTPGTSPVPSSAVSIFSSDLTSFSGWSTVQNHQGSSTTGYPLSIVNDGSGHETAARFEVRPGDTAISGERSEIRFPSSCNVSEGDTRWYEWDWKFPTDFQGIGPSGGWLICMQWHPGSGSPQMGFEVTSDEQLALVLAENQYHKVGAANDGKWHRYTLKAKFSNTGGSTSHDLWRDGVKVLTGVQGKNMNSSSNYMKTGIYRNSASFTSVVLIDRVRVWSA